MRVAADSNVRKVQHLSIATMSVNRLHEVISHVGRTVPKVEAWVRARRGTRYVVAVDDLDWLLREFHKRRERHRNTGVGAPRRDDRSWHLSFGKVELHRLVRDHSLDVVARHRRQPPRPAARRMSEQNPGTNLVE